MKTIFLTTLLAIAIIHSYAQIPQGNKMGKQNMNIGHFYGKIVDSKTNKGIAAVTVQLTGNKFDTATKKIKQAILNTVITENHGDFSLEGLPIFGNFTLKISSLGYKPIEKQINFGIKFPQAGAATAQNGLSGMQKILDQVDKDLGNIKLEPDATDLGNVTVTASAKQQFELGIDRKIFNVDKNLESTGQTATEIMKNIPSVNVDIDGNVTLRNAAPIIFVDDRPTTLTLDQIPSDIIDKIEIITNPSAKYDASGGNAGIINIILKKNRKFGYNGGVRAGTDSWGKVNGGGDFSVREGKINAFVNGNYNQRKFVSEGTTNQNNFFNPPSNANSVTSSNNNGEFRFLRAGIDFLADNRNTFTVAGNYVRGHFNFANNFNTDSLINLSNVANNQSTTGSDRTFENTGVQFGYKHNFAKSGENLTADVNLNTSNNHSSSDNSTYTFFPNSTIQKQNPLLQQTYTQGYNKFYTIQSDYENPISDKVKLEAGVRAAIRDFGNNSSQLKYNTYTGTYVEIPAISNNYKYNDQVYAGYINYSAKRTKWNYQLGLRVESSNYTGTLLNNKGTDSSTFAVKYPVSLFPSAFLTYKLTDKQDLQINYSRRVNRPNFFQLMPFPNYSNYPIIVLQGNAGLNPEFTNSMELSYNNNYKTNSNFLATAYFKYATNLITQYIYRDKNALSNGNDSVYYSTYINANSGISYGIELTNKMQVTKWWELMLNANIFNSKINASSVNSNTSHNISIATNSILSWFGKVNSTFKLPKSYSIQISGYYQSKTVLPQNGGGGGGGPFNQVQTTAQGYILPKYGVDMAIRKDWNWKKGRTGSLTLSMNDILKTEYQRTFSEQTGLFNQNTERISNPQVLRLTFSYRFGKFDTSLFKRKNTKFDQNGNSVDMMP